MIKYDLTQQFEELKEDDLYLYPAFEETVIGFLMGAESFPPPSLCILGEWKVLAEWIAANYKRLLIIINETVDIPYSFSNSGESRAGVLTTAYEVRALLGEIYSGEEK